MEVKPRLKRLKRLSESFTTEASNEIKFESDNEKSSSETISSLESGSLDPAISKSKKPKPSKNKAPKLPVFNKLLDLKSHPDDFQVTEFEYLRNAPLELSNQPKKEKKLSFLHKVTNKKQDKTTYSLAKSVLTNKNESDTLIVETPIKIEGFITKSHTLNPREIFRGQLKDIINEKKTNHIQNSEIFEKPITDFVIKDEVCEKNSVVHDNPEEKRLKSYPSTSASSPVYVRKEKPQLNPFIEAEAVESGSEHGNSKDSAEENNENTVKDLIDDTKIEENKEEAYAKHLRDMVEKEYKELNMVVNGSFKRKNEEENWKSRKIIKTEETAKIQTNPSVFSRIEDEFDEEERFNFLNQVRNIKNIRNKQEKTIVLDEQSTDYLKLIEKPEQTRLQKTLLNSDSSKSNSLVFASDSHGQNAFFKIKKEIKTEPKFESSIFKPKNKLLSFIKK